VVRLALQVLTCAGSAKGVVSSPNKEIHEWIPDGTGHKNGPAPVEDLLHVAGNTPCVGLIEELVDVGADVTYHDVIFMVKAERLCYAVSPGCDNAMKYVKDPDFCSSLNDYVEMRTYADGMVGPFSPVMSIVAVGEAGISEDTVGDIFLRVTQAIVRIAITPVLHMVEAIITVGRANICVDVKTIRQHHCSLELSGLVLLHDRW
jgi:hypothetical protein